LIVKNNSARDFAFENCLHPYFAVGDINAVSVAGLKARSTSINLRVSRAERRPPNQFDLQVKWIAFT